MDLVVLLLLFGGRLFDLGEGDRVVELLVRQFLADRFFEGLFAQSLGLLHRFVELHEAHVVLAGHLLEIIEHLLGGDLDLPFGGLHLFELFANEELDRLVGALPMLPHRLGDFMQGNRFVFDQYRDSADDRLGVKGEREKSE